MKWLEKLLIFCLIISLVAYYLYGVMLFVLYLLVWFFLAFVWGITEYDKMATEEQKVTNLQMIKSQTIIFLALFFILYLLAEFFKTIAVKPFLEQTFSYFEMGSYSLIITGLIFRDNKNYAKKIGRLTLAATFIFFVMGLFLSLLEITNQTLPLSTYIQNAAFFLGTYNLTWSVILLFDYFDESKR